MQLFRKILLADTGHDVGNAALLQALSTARNNKAQLASLVVCPEFPKSLHEYAHVYETALKDRLALSLQETRSKLAIGHAELPCEVNVMQTDRAGFSISREAASAACDLVIKNAEPVEGGAGFSSVDIDLLRKCPLPVWLCRPITHHRNDIKVAVAIDPSDEAEPARSLSVRLLRMARELADAGNGEVTIISCHDFRFGDFIKDAAGFLTDSGEKIQALQLENVREQDMRANRAILDDLIVQSGIGTKVNVQHLHGRPEHVIPQYVSEHGIDILVMGTVARAGVAELLIGNTAESIVRNLSCSLVALKPEGVGKA